MAVVTNYHKLCDLKWHTSLLMLLLWFRSPTWAALAWRWRLVFHSFSGFLVLWCCLQAWRWRLVCRSLFRIPVLCCHRQHNCSMLRVPHPVPWDFLPQSHFTHWPPRQGLCSETEWARARDVCLQSSTILFSRELKARHVDSRTTSRLTSIT